MLMLQEIMLCRCYHPFVPLQRRERDKLSGGAEIKQANESKKLGRSAEGVSNRSSRTEYHFDTNSF